MGKEKKVGLSERSRREDSRISDREAYWIRIRKSDVTVFQEDKTGNVHRLFQHGSGTTVKIHSGLYINEWECN